MHVSLINAKSYRGQRELSMGLQLPQTDLNHIAISHSCQAVTAYHAFGKYWMQAWGFLNIVENIAGRKLSTVYVVATSPVVLR